MGKPGRFAIIHISWRLWENVFHVPNDQTTNELLESNPFTRWGFAYILRGVPLEG